MVTLLHVVIQGPGSSLAFPRVFLWPVWLIYHRVYILSSKGTGGKKGHAFFLKDVVAGPLFGTGNVIAGWCTPCTLSQMSAAFHLLWQSWRCAALMSHPETSGHRRTVS